MWPLGPSPFAAAGAWRVGDSIRNGCSCLCPCSCSCSCSCTCSCSRSCSCPRSPGPSSGRGRGSALGRPSPRRTASSWPSCFLCWSVIGSGVIIDSSSAAVAVLDNHPGASEVAVGAVVYPRVMTRRLWGDATLALPGFLPGTLAASPPSLSLSPSLYLSVTVAAVLSHGWRLFRLLLPLRESSSLRVFHFACGVCCPFWLPQREKVTRKREKEPLAD